MGTGSRRGPPAHAPRSRRVAGRRHRNVDPLFPVAPRRPDRRGEPHFHAVPRWLDVRAEASGGGRRRGVDGRGRPGVDGRGEETPAPGRPGLRIGTRGVENRAGDLRIARMRFRTRFSDDKAGRTLDVTIGAPSFEATLEGVPLSGDALAVRDGVWSLVGPDGRQIEVSIAFQTDGSVRAYAAGCLFGFELLDELTARALAATCLLYTSPSPRDGLLSRMPSSS